MNAVRQKCRPKHQVLVLKCYPRYQKNVQEVKPNSSELSYLLYYATTRRSKLQKVGAFLEKKTASDVWRGKLGNVQVTLQILTALIEKAPRDLPLYSGMVLTILDTVLRSNDLNMIEESLPTFEAYCKHQDAAAAATVLERSNKYQEIVNIYASFASTDFLKRSNTPVSAPTAIRWRTIGLRAVKAVVESESFGTDSGRRLNVVMPIILDNLYSDGEDLISRLHHRTHSSEKMDIEQARRRRMSVNTVATVDTIEANPLTAASTTADADKVAEDEVRVLAVRCLKQIFSAGYGSSRGQIRLATQLVLKCIALRKPSPVTTSRGGRPSRQGNWATSLMETVARWTPVQDRFIIVVTAVETLTRSPIVEAKLDMQLTLATMIDWLLSSTINLIGLSVMDVLLGFVHHILLLLQLGGRDSKIVPHQQQSLGVDLFRDGPDTFGSNPIVDAEPRGRSATESSTTPSRTRQDLLLRLQKCIGDLATHIYYTDQISDMIMAVLTRLKPSPTPEVSTTAAAIENPAAAANAIANSVSLQEDSTTDGFFSFATARETALNAVKDILIVANLRKSMTGSSVETRSRVPLHVWEGTQWLLRDEPAVRLSYVDAFLAWLKLETNKNDLQLTKEGSRSVKSPKRDLSDATETKLARRAASTASKKDRLSDSNKSTFLKLLHLAVYENALEEAEDETNILLMYLLLTNAVEKLGVNASRHGLPMIFKLQEDVQAEQMLGTPRAKVNVASLVHGYFGAVSEKFDFETSRVGAEIHGEISRRREKDLWLEEIRFPPILLDQIAASAPSDNSNRAAPDTSGGALKPYTNRQEMIDEIANAYDASLLSPPASPAISPGRVFSVPSLGFGYGYSTVPHSKTASEDSMPEKVKEEFAAEWSRDAIIAAVEKDSAQASSITGSKKTATASMPRNYLSVTANGNGNGLGANGDASGNASPTYPPDLRHSHGGRASPGTYGLVGGLGSLQKLRRISTQEGSPTALTPSSSRESTVRVNELKRVLSTSRGNPRHTSPLGLRPDSGRAASMVSSSSSESMLTYDDAEAADMSAVDVNQPVAFGDGPESSRPKSSPQPGTVEKDGNNPPRPSTGVPSYSTLGSHKEYIRPGSRHKDEDIPPVPKIPSSLNLPGGFPQDGSPVRPSTAKSEGARQHSPIRPASAFHSTVTDREGRSMTRGKSRRISRKDRAAEINTWIANERGDLFSHRVDLGKLLAGIDAGVGGPPQDARDSKVVRPPY